MPGLAIPPLLQSLRSASCVFANLPRELDFACEFDNDAAFLANDFFEVFFGGGYSVLLTGLTNGPYDVYLYAPNGSLRFTGAGNVNDVPFTNAGGFVLSDPLSQPRFTLAAGVAVTDGTMLVTGFGGEVGLSGMQIVDRSLIDPSTTVPEAGTMLLVSGALAIVLHRLYRRARRTRHLA